MFAFGLILAEMLTGTRPAPGTLKFPAHLPPRLARVVERCLSPDPDDRWQAAADVGWELATVDSAPPVQQARSRRERWIWAVAVVLLAAIAVAQRFTGPAPSDRAPLRFTVPPPENGRFLADIDVVTPAISPDGRTLAFVASVEGQTRIWIRPLDSDVPRVLAGTHGVLAAPFWSPDSRSLAFFAESKLKRIAIAGGPPQTICDMPSAPGSGSWSPKGVILFGSGSAGLSSLYRVPANGGTVSEIRRPDPSKDEDGLVFPEFLPTAIGFSTPAASRTRRVTACTSGRSAPRRARSSRN